MECTQGFDLIVKRHAADGRLVQRAGRASSVALTQEAHCAPQLLHFGVAHRPRCVQHV